jgi:hypothetical protein
MKVRRKLICDGHIVDDSATGNGLFCDAITETGEDVQSEELDL